MLCEQKPAEPSKPKQKVESVNEPEPKSQQNKPESKSELQTDSKSESKTELKPDSKTQPTPENKQDIKTQDTKSQPDTRTPDTKPTEKNEEVKGLAGRKESLTAKVKTENIPAFAEYFFTCCEICIMLSYCCLC